MAESTFGRRAVNDGKFVARLRDGARVTPETLERVNQFMTKHGGTGAGDAPPELMPRVSALFAPWLAELWTILERDYLWPTGLPRNRRAGPYAVFVAGSEAVYQNIQRYCRKVGTHNDAAMFYPELDMIVEERVDRGPFRGCQPIGNVTSGIAVTGSAATGFVGRARRTARPAVQRVSLEIDTIVSAAGAGTGGCFTWVRVGVRVRTRAA